MKLSEALMQRKDLIKEIKKMEEEVLNNLIHLDEEKAEAEGKGILYQIDSIYQELIKDLKNLNIIIDRANKPIMENIKSMQILDREISFLNQIRKKIINKDIGTTAFYREPTSLYTALTVENVNLLLKEKEEARRELDKKIQEFNWKTELKDI